MGSGSATMEQFYDIYSWTNKLSGYAFHREVDSCDEEFNVLKNAHEYVNDMTRTCGISTDMLRIYQTNHHTHPSKIKPLPEFLSKCSCKNYRYSFHCKWISEETYKEYCCGKDYAVLWNCCCLCRFTCPKFMYWIGCPYFTYRYGRALCQICWNNHCCCCNDNIST